MILINFNTCSSCLKQIHVALDHQTEENGCIHYIRGSHKWHRNGKPLPVTDYNFKDMESIKVSKYFSQQFPELRCLKSFSESLSKAIFTGISEILSLQYTGGSFKQFCGRNKSKNVLEVKVRKQQCARSFLCEQIGFMIITWSKDKVTGCASSKNNFLFKTCVGAQPISLKKHILRHTNAYPYSQVYMKRTHF